MTVQPESTRDVLARSWIKRHLATMNAQERSYKQADAILAALAAAGYAVVPVEPNEAMLEAADEPFWDSMKAAKASGLRMFGKEGVASEQISKHVYAAMLAAAPKP